MGPLGKKPDMGPLGKKPDMGPLGKEPDIGPLGQEPDRKWMNSVFSCVDYCLENQAGVVALLPLGPQFNVLIRWTMRAIRPPFTSQNGWMRRRETD